MMTFDIIIDAQGDFMYTWGALPVPGAEEIIPGINEYLHNLKPDETVGVLYTFDTHNPETYAESLEGSQFPGHCFKDTPGWQLAVTNTIANGIPVYRLEKGVFNMWEESNLQVIQTNGGRYDEVLSFDREAFFEDLKTRGVNKLRIKGVATNFCVKWAVDGAIARGFEVEVDENHTRGIDTEPFTGVHNPADTDVKLQFAEYIAQGKLTVV
jgi:nicotinamidase/pyrazinamidase